MKLKHIVASGLLAAVTIGVLAFPAQAADKGLMTQVEEMASLDWQSRAPGAKVTRLEAATAIGRITGSAADVISLLGPGDPEGHISRLETIVLLVKAAGYESEAMAKMETVLPYTDSAHIPAAQVGYVAAALDHNLVGGFPDRTFRPEQAVKRIELAVMLSKVERQPTPPPAVEGQVITGEVVMLHQESPARVSVGWVDNGVFTMATFDLPAAAPILAVGDMVRLTLKDDVVILCEIVR